MLSRWIQENQRFLAKVGGAALLLLIFQWWFVWSQRRAYEGKRRTYDSNVTALKRLYGNEDPPVGKRRDQRTKELDVVKAALDEALRTYGARPESPYVLPAGEEEKPQNYYFEQQTRVLEQIREAAVENAVDLTDNTLGLPQSLPRDGDAKTTVRQWLWNLAVVRRACLSAVTAGVDKIERVQEIKAERGAREGRVEIYGQPQQFEVAGKANAVARWLESLQREDNYLVLVQVQIKREPQELGVVRCKALIMGVNRREQAAEAEE